VEFGRDGDPPPKMLAHRLAPFDVEAERREIPAVRDRGRGVLGGVRDAADEGLRPQRPAVRTPADQRAVQSEARERTARALAACGELPSPLRRGATERLGFGFRERLGLRVPAPLDRDDAGWEQRFERARPAPQLPFRSSIFDRHGPSVRHLGVPIDALYRRYRFFRLLHAMERA